MTLLFIHLKDEEYHSCDEGAEYDRPEAALSLGVRSAMMIISDEVNSGERNAAVEVSIEQENGNQILCSVVAISVSPLTLLSAG